MMDDGDKLRLLLQWLPASGVDREMGEKDIAED